MIRPKEPRALEASAKFLLVAYDADLPVADRRGADFT
jgi:hypothetical protein